MREFGSGKYCLSCIPVFLITTHGLIDYIVERTNLLKIRPLNL
jgi:hypothetical protein